MFQRVHSVVAVLGSLAFSVFLVVQPAYAQTWRLIGRGGDGDWGETPIVAELKVPVPDGSYVLETGSQSEPIPAVVFGEGERRFLATILPRILAQQPFSYRMKGRPIRESQPSTGIRFRPKGRNLLVTLDQRLWTEYHVDTGTKPFFFPLIGPTGESYTRAYPMEMIPGEDRDHPHQRSCWFTHGNVNGVDFWSEGKGTGTIRETARRLVVEGPVLGRLWTKNEWRASDDQKICEDERTVTFYRTTNLRIMDFVVNVSATAGPVTFGDTKEGSFGLRVASSMDVDKKLGGKITNAEGLTDEKAWGQSSPWVDYIGPVNEKVVGIAVLNHPDSFRYPTTWHVRTYGLFAANPFGWHDFGKPARGDYTLPAGQMIRFAYRVILHRDDTLSLGLPERFRAYAKPPAVEVKSD
jgi:hypothetical protein